jgi:hypothetical protein
LNKRTQTLARTLILFALAGAGPTLGCIDLTPPWQKPGYRADASGNAGDFGGGGSPADAEGKDPIEPDVGGATSLLPEVPVDAEGSPSQRDDGGPGDAPSSASDAGLFDASPDRTTGEADANDAIQRPVDSSSDVHELGSSPGGHDGPLYDLTVSSPDNSLTDTDVKVPVPDGGLSDTPVDATFPSLDAGRDVLAIAGLLASYPCENASGAVLPDTSGHGKNAALANGAGGSTPVGFSFGTGRVGNALALSSRDQAYVSLPRGILSQLSQVTIATWVKLTSSTAFQRIFDFGVDTNTFMYLVNATGSGIVRFRIVSTSLNKNQVVEGAEGVPVGRWAHVAVTLGDNGVSIYLDGAQVAQQAPAIMRPSDLGDTGNNFIGRSPFAADPYLDGQIDEFRIYDRVLSPAEIGELANGG